VRQLHLNERGAVCVCSVIYLADRYSYAIPIYEGIVTLAVIVNFAMATFLDPGIYPKCKYMHEGMTNFNFPAVTLTIFLFSHTRGARGGPYECTDVPHYRHKSDCGADEVVQYLLPLQTAANKPLFSVQPLR
jgi:hypothetical protein